MEFFFGGYDEKKLKANLKMSVHRIKIAFGRESNLAITNKKNIAGLLKEGKVELAQIKTEQIIRTDELLEAYAILELILEILHERLHYISECVSGGACPEDLKESVSSIVFSAKRLNIKELETCSQHFGYKFGKKFIQASEKNEGNMINPRLFNKISLLKIKTSLVNAYLREIANTYGVEYEEIEADEDAVMPAPTGTSVPVAPATNLTAAYTTSVAEQRPITPTPHPLDDTKGCVDAGAYSGETSEDGHRHGKGTAEYANGSVYVGTWFKGMRHGKGKMTYAGGAVVYEGDFFDDRRQGRGVLSREGQTLHSGGWFMGNIQDVRQRAQVAAVLPDAAMLDPPLLTPRITVTADTTDATSASTDTKMEDEKTAAVAPTTQIKRANTEKNDLDDLDKERPSVPTSLVKDITTNAGGAGGKVDSGTGTSDTTAEKGVELDALAARLAALRK